MQTLQHWKLTNCQHPPPPRLLSGGTIRDLRTLFLLCNFNSQLRNYLLYKKKWKPET